MYHSTAIFSGLASLGLAAMIYYCTILSRPGGMARSEMLTMILMSLLVGIYPLAIISSVMALVSLVAGGVSLQSLMAGGLDLLSLGLVLVTFGVLRALVRASYRGHSSPTGVTPLEPRPHHSNSGKHRPMKLAA